MSAKIIMAKEMTKARSQLLQEAASHLEKSGFSVSKQCDVRPSCFDLVGKKGNQLLLVKVLANIDALTKEDAIALQVVAQFFNATPLVIGHKTRRGELDSGVVYKRFGVPTISPPSFQELVIEGDMPREFIQRGGRFVAIDGAKLKEIRLSQNMTKEDLAGCVQVSARAILAYEKDEMDVSKDVAERLEKVFETDLIIPIDLLSDSIIRPHIAPPKRPQDIPHLEERVNKFFERLGMKVLWTDRAPFHVAAKEVGPPLMSGVGSIKSWGLQKRMDIIKSVSDVTNADAVIIVEEGSAEETVADLPVIKQLELDDIEETDELKEIISDRSGN